MTTERLSILAAAVALGEFTAPQLAAYTGANPNTVRQVLRREQERRELFDHGEPGQRVSRGRATLWRLKDPSAVLDEIADEESELAGLHPHGSGARDRTEAVSWLHRMDVLLLSAEDAAAQSYDVEDATEQKAFAQIAINLLWAADPDTSSTNRKGRHWWEHPPDVTEGKTPRVIGLSEGRPGDSGSVTGLFVLDANLIYQRARSVAAFAYLAARRAEGLSVGTEHLLPVAEAIAAGSKTLPPQVTENWLRRIVGVSLGQSRHPPPIAVLTQEERSPDDLFPISRGRWRRIGSPPAIASERYSVWVEDWAEPLFLASLMPGVVISHEDTPESNSVLSQVLAENERSRYAQATIVASSTADFRVIARVSGGGGTFYPIHEARDGLLQTVNRAVMQAVRLTYGPLVAKFAGAFGGARNDVLTARRVDPTYERALSLLMRVADFYWPYEARSTAEQCISIYHRLIEERRPGLFANIAGVDAVGEEVVEYPPNLLLQDVGAVETTYEGATYWDRNSLRLQPKTEPRLTSIETKIAELIATGIPNNAIADALGISAAATARHIARIRAKLGLGTRAQIVSWAGKEGMAADQPDTLTRGRPVRRAAAEGRRRVGRSDAVPAAEPPVNESRRSVSRRSAGRSAPSDAGRSDPKSTDRGDTRGRSPGRGGR